MLNGWIGTAATIIFGIHGISMGLFLAGYLPYSYTRKYWGYALLICVVCHATLSIILTFFEGGKLEADRYVKINKASHLQRLLGIIAIFAIAGHMKAYGHFTEEWVYIVHEITTFGFIKQVLLAAVVGGHLIIGFPKAMITTGYIRNPQEIKNQKNFACALVFITCFIGIYGACNYFGIL